MEFELRCPHCKSLILLHECKTGGMNILRHGVLKENNQLILPQLSNELVLQLVQKNLIYGCGKLYKITRIVQKNGHIGIIAVKYS